MRVLITFLLASLVAVAEPPTDLRTRKTGSDWPIFLGPTSNSVSTETGILTKWPRDGLKVVWEVPMGLGYAPPVVSRGRLFHFDRFGDDNRLTCRNAETGKLLWKFEYPTNYDDLYHYSPGPRACPVVDDDRVYILGPEGMLHCISIPGDGKQLWKVDTLKEYHVHQNFFGVGSVPVIEGDLLIVPIGGSRQGPAADRSTRSKGQRHRHRRVRQAHRQGSYRGTDELASYSSPILATIGGKQLCLYFAACQLGRLRSEDRQAGLAVSLAGQGRRERERELPGRGRRQRADHRMLRARRGAPEGEPGKCTAVWTDDEKDREDKACSATGTHPSTSMATSTDRAAGTRTMRNCAASNWQRARSCGKRTTLARVADADRRPFPVPD